MTVDSVDTKSHGNKRKIGIMDNDNKDNKRFFQYHGQSIADEARHELDLVLNDETCAFFSVVLTARLLGDDYIDLVPTVIMIGGRMTKAERLRMAKAIVDLGRHVRDSALSNEENKDDG